MSDNATTVRTFLEALAVPDLPTVRSLLAPDVEWRNTGLPTLRGKRVFAALEGMEKSKVGFDVDFHAIAADGDQVLTDRTDYIFKGRLRTGFWVRGTFTVRDGKITVWDDAFSMRKLLTGFFRRR